LSGDQRREPVYRLLQRLAENSPIGIFVLRDGRFEYVNPQFQTITEYTWDELKDTYCLDIVRPDDREGVKAAATAMLKGNRSAPYEYRVITKSGGQRWILETVTSLVMGGSSAVMGNFVDITERKSAEEALFERARRDSLTGLLNHGAIVEELADALRAGPGRPLAVALVDLLEFKSVNDALGHQAGDAVLATVASVLQRRGALVGRYGGDEFLVVLQGADEGAAESYREDVLGKLAEVSLLDARTGRKVSPAVTIGIAVAPEQGDNVTDLISAADWSMYAARKRRVAATSGVFLAVTGRGGAIERAADEVEAILQAPGDLEAKLRVAARHLCLTNRYDAVTIYLKPAWMRGPPIVNMYPPLPRDYLERWSRQSIRHSDHPLRRYLEHTRRPLIVDDFQSQAAYMDAEEAANLDSLGLRSMVAAPILDAEEVIGAFIVTSWDVQAFTEKDGEFLLKLGQSLAAAFISAIKGQPKRDAAA
jgi:diguanylate cyclase (GGDEF)-like protein/PAS domain S-box-containing protein